MLTKRTTAALGVALVLAVGACSSGDNTGASPANGASAAPPGASQAASGGAPAGAADISGTLRVDAKYGCKPIPCTPGEGA